MKSATFAALAPPEWSSAGMIVSDNSSTSSCCKGVKKREGKLFSEDLPTGLAGAVSACGCSSVTAGRGSNEAPTMAAEVFSHSRRSCRGLTGLLLDMLNLQGRSEKFDCEVVPGRHGQ